MHYDSISSTSRRSTAIDNQQHSIEFMVLVLTDNHRRWITEYLRKKKALFLHASKSNQKPYSRVLHGEKNAPLFLTFAQKRKTAAVAKLYFLATVLVWTIKAFLFHKNTTFLFFQSFLLALSHMYTHKHTHTLKHMSVCVCGCVYVWWELTVFAFVLV